MKHGRKRPYTEIGIARLKCSRAGCRRRAVFQWRPCSLDAWMPICDRCDVELNEIALTFLRIPKRERDRLMDRYRALVELTMLRHRFRS